MQRASLWHSALAYFNTRTALPVEAMGHDVTTAWEPHEATQDKLIWLHVNDPEASMVGEALVDLDEGLQEWRYRHVKMVERTIGRKIGSGGSAGAGYLASTLFNPVFPDLWAIRSRF